MKNNSGREVEERKLFHGTDSKHVNAICLNNFDWRICGVNGTAYGKGGLTVIVQGCLQHLTVLIFFFSSNKYF